MRSEQFPSCCDLYLTSAPLPSADGWQECDGNDRALVEGARDCSLPPCESGTHRAAPFYPERDCVGTGVFVGCAELIDPAESVPQDWPTERCVRRLSDGALFLASMPVRAGEWDECPPDDAAILDAAAACD